MRPPHKRLSAWLVRAGLDRRGVAAVEFAIIFPMLLVLYLGGYEVSEAVAVYRKVTITTTELANVASQYQTMSTTDISNVLNASAQIMAPYSSGNLTIVMSEITTDSSGNPTVTWSKTLNGTALTTGASVTMPTGMAAVSTCYMLIQTTYNYVPTVGSAYVSTMPMSDQMFIQPRSSSCITLS